MKRFLPLIGAISLALCFAFALAFALHAQDRVLSGLCPHCSRPIGFIIGQDHVDVMKPAPPPRFRTLEVETPPVPAWVPMVTNNGLISFTNTVPQGVIYRLTDGGTITTSNATPRITPKSRFVDDCPHCGTTNIKSSSIASTGGNTVSNGTELQWSISWKCPKCDGQWSDTKTSTIPKRQPRQIQ